MHGRVSVSDIISGFSLNNHNKPQQLTKKLLNFEMPPGHPLASRAKVWLPFRPESLLSRDLEGVVVTAAALVSQKHHLR